MNKIKLKAEFTKKGVPCLWESGGFDTALNQGHARIITDYAFSKKLVIYTKKEVNGNHALIPVVTGDKLIEVVFDNGITEVMSYVLIVDIIKKEITMELENKKFLSSLGYTNAVKTATAKAKSPNCQMPIYVRFAKRDLNNVSSNPPRKEQMSQGL